MSDQPWGMWPTEIPVVDVEPVEEVHEPNGLIWWVVECPSGHGRHKVEAGPTYQCGNVLWRIARGEVA